MTSISPQARSIESALKQRGVFTVMKHPGLTLHSRGDGNGSFSLRYRPAGSVKKVRFMLTNDVRAVLNAAPVEGVSGLEQLYRKASQIQTDLKVHGKDPHAELRARRSQQKSYADLFEEWFEQHAKREKRERSWLDDRAIYKLHIEPRIGRLALKDITKRIVLDMLEDVVKATVDVDRGHYGLKAKHVFAIVRASFRWGVSKDLVHNNPCLGIKRPITPRKRNRKVTESEIAALWIGLDKLRIDYAIIGKLGLLTGKRISAIVNMEKRELELDTPNAIWTIPGERDGNKNSEDDIVCLSPLAVELFREAIARAPAAAVFPAGNGKPMDRCAPSKAFVALSESLGIEDLTFHDCRHVVGTQLASMGVPAEIRQRVLHHVTGRKSSPTTDIYDEHDYLAEKRRALLLWQYRLIEIIERRPPMGGDGTQKNPMKSCCHRRRDPRKAYPIFKMTDGVHAPGQSLNSLLVGDRMRKRQGPLRKFRLFRKFRVRGTVETKGGPMPRTDFDPTAAPEGEALIADAVSRALESHDAGARTGMRLQITEAGHEVTTLDVPPSAAALIRTLLREMAGGKAVAVVADDAEITTQQAADLLHVSRPFVVGLVDKGDLPARNVGKQRRLMLKDVLVYKRDNEAKRREVLRELTALDQELGMR